MSCKETKLARHEAKLRKFAERIVKAGPWKVYSTEYWEYLISQEMLRMVNG